MKLTFTPEDFSRYNTFEECAKSANAKLEAFIKEHGKVVLCTKLGESNLTTEHGPGWMACEESTRLGKHPTHKAVLINIEAFKPCKHEGLMVTDAMYPETRWKPQCKHCGVKLKPTGWEAE